MGDREEEGARRGGSRVEEREKEERKREKGVGGREE